MKGRPKLNLVGQKFGMLTVVELAEIKEGHSKFLCQCDCGTYKIIDGSKIKRGAIRSCGCLMNAGLGCAKKRHGMKGTRLYRIWKNMQTRCRNANTPQYKQYGARGVRVCDEWKDSVNFIKWATENGYADNLTLDRIDNNGGYCPENCRWVTPLENNQNRSITVKVLYENELQPLSNLCKRFGIKLGTARYRLARGWSIKDTLTIPPSFKNGKRGITNEA